MSVLEETANNDTTVFKKMIRDLYNQFSDVGLSLEQVTSVASETLNVSRTTEVIQGIIYLDMIYEDKNVLPSVDEHARVYETLRSSGATKGLYWSQIVDELITVATEKNFTPVSAFNIAQTLRSHQEAIGFMKTYDPAKGELFDDALKNYARIRTSPVIRVDNDCTVQGLISVHQRPVGIPTQEQVQNYLS